MLSEAAYYRSVAIAQLLLSAERSDLQPDGKWGRYTDSVYRDVSPALRARVDDALARLAPPTTASALRDFRNAQRPKSSDSSRAPKGPSPGVEAVKAVIRRVAAEEGVPAKTALTIANLESRFNAMARSPTGATGVMQLTQIAIDDVAKRANYVVSDRYDLEQNVRGGIKYMKIVARDMGVRLDQTAELYMGFNIGPTGAKFVLTGQPQRAANQISKQRYGKRGPEFYAADLRRAVTAETVV